MKTLVLFSIAVLLLAVSGACAPTVSPTTAPTDSDMLHIGNYDVETTNKLILAASAANIRYSLSEPSGEGCIQASDCTWDAGDKAFHIEKDKVEAFWQSWEALYCGNNSTEELCPPNTD